MSKLSGRKHPDVEFKVILNTSTGRENLKYRFWFYEAKREWRLRVRHATIDLITSEIENLLIINKFATPIEDDVFHEVTVLPQTNQTFTVFLSLCTKDAGGNKKWGIIDIL